MSPKRQVSLNSRRRLSGYAKTVILLQGVIIAFLSLWVYEEYLNNQYFQAYVDNVFRSNGEAYVLIPTLVLTILAVVAYAKIRTYNSMGESTHVNRVENDEGGPGNPPGIVISPSSYTFPQAPSGTPALASAATRVVRRIAIGERSINKSSDGKPMPVLEKIESKTSFQTEQRIQPIRSTPKEPESLRPSANMSLAEQQQVSRLARKPENPPRSPPPPWRPSITSTPSESRPASPALRPQESFNPFKQAGFGGLNVGGSLSSNRGRPLTGVESDRGPRNNNPPRFQPFAKLTGPKSGVGQGPVPHSPVQAAKQSTIGRGPLDNPLPENSLVPVLKRAQPSAAPGNGPSLARPLYELRQRASQQASTVGPFRDAPMIQRPAVSPPRAPEKSSSQNPSIASKPQSSAMGLQLPQKSLAPNFVGQKILDGQKPLVPRLAPPVNQPTPRMSDGTFLEKRPLIPEGFGERQAYPGKVPVRKIETVLKRLQPETRPTDELPAQTVHPGSHTPTANSKGSPSSRVSFHSIEQVPEKVQPRKQGERKGRPGLNRVEPLPGAADNAWARRLPSDSGRESSEPETQDKALKRSAVRKKVETKPEEGELGSDELQ